MKCYAVATIDHKGRPAYFHFENPQKALSFEIHRAGGGKRLGETFKRFDGAREVLSWAAAEDLRCHNFGDLLRTFNLEELHGDTLARDYALPSLKTTGDSDQDRAICERVVQVMQKIPDQPYQQLLAKAQSVYTGLERSGLMLNYTKVDPQWSWETYSGRSKSTGFNIQGWSEPDVIYQPSTPYENLQIQFDWICADFRVAALMSGDAALNASFFESDPYTYLSKRLSGCGEQMRDDAKLLLLKTINSLDYNDEVVRGEFPQLCDWLQGTLAGIARDKRSQNIAGRPFRLEKNRSERSVFNAVLQGSVAAAMQSVLWKVRREFPSFLITDIHDGLVLTVPRDKSIIHHVVENVGRIFLRPFDGVFSTDLVFPYRVSVGNRWKQWKEMLTVRSEQT